MGKGRSPSVTIACEKCGALFHPWHPKKTGRFCSRACSPRGRQPTLKDIPCEQCGVLFRPLAARTRFCSRKCYRDNGGRSYLNTGYVTIYKPEHPRATKSGSVLEHIVVMEEKLGRPVQLHETVHHLNGVKDDNRPENLQLRQGRHGKGFIMVCGDCGSNNVVSQAITDSDPQQHELPLA